MHPQTNYKEGDLLKIKSYNQWSICVPTDILGRNGKQAREYAMTSIPMGFGKSFMGLEEKLGLIVKVIRNKLDQPQGYQVQIGQDIWFFKSVLAQKYFELVGDDDNADGSTC
jgi:hypothetical protein